MDAEATRLPVTKILLTAFVAPFLHTQKILWFAIPLIALNIVLIDFQTSFPQAIVAGIALNLLAYLATITLTIACHRIFILGEESMKGFWMVWWTWREFAFIGWSFAIGITVAMLAFPAVMILAPRESAGMFSPTSLLAWCVILPALYVSCRLSLVLPATATDSQSSFEHAWTLSRGNGFRLTAVVGLVPILFVTILNLLPEFRSLIYSAVISITVVFVIVIEVAALSYSYRELTNSRQIVPAESSPH